MHLINHDNNTVKKKIIKVLDIRGEPAKNIVICPGCGQHLLRGRSESDHAFFCNKLKKSTTGVDS